MRRPIIKERCGVCGEKMDPRDPHTQVVDVSSGKREVWGVFHRVCLYSALGTPRSVLEAMRAAKESR